MKYAGAFALALLVAGCGGSVPTTSAVPQSRQISGIAQQPPSTARLFLGDGYNGNVDMFDTTGKQLGQIAGVYPEALAVDDASNLWVGDSSNYTLQQFPSPYTSPALTLRDTAGTPGAIAVNAAPGPQHGLLAVGSFPRSGFSSLRFFARGHLTPCKTLLLASPAYSLAFDSRGDLYIGSTRTIQRALHGCGATKVYNLHTTNQLPRLGYKVAVLPNGNVAVLMSGNPNSTIFTYAPAVDASLGSPIATTSIALTDAFSFAFMPDGKHVWVPDTINARVEEFAFPSGKAETSFAGSLNYYSIALSP